MNLALSGLPDFRALPGTAPGPQHRATMHICPSVEYIERAWDDAKYGRPSRFPLIEMTIPTMYDPSLAPEGRHIMGIFLQYAPYTSSRNAPGMTKREPYAERVLDVIEEYCPNIRLGSSSSGRRPTPLDLERRFGLTGGNIFHGEMEPSIRCFSCAPWPVGPGTGRRSAVCISCGSGAHSGRRRDGRGPGHNRPERDPGGSLALNVCLSRHGPVRRAFRFLRSARIEHAWPGPVSRHAPEWGPL